MRFAVIILLALAYSAHATITRVQSATGSVGSSNGTSFNVTVSALTAGNFLVVGIVGTIANVRSFTVTPASITDLAGGKVAETFDSSGSTTVTMHMYRILVGGATTLTITNPGGAAQGMAAIVAEYSATNLTLDLWNFSTGSASTTASAGVTGTTNYANELMLGFISTKVACSSVQTAWATLPTNSFSSVVQTSTNTNNIANDRPIVLCEKIVTTAGAADVSVTVGASQRNVGTIATFREVPQVVSRMGGD